MKKIIMYLFICMVAIFTFNSMVSASDTELNITMLQFPSGSDENGDAYKNAGGDAVLLESKGEYLLMDTFNPTSILDTALMHPIIKYLKDNNITRISVYLSHYHSDHYGGLKNLLLADGITVERLYLPKTEYFCNYYDIDSNFTTPYFYKRYTDMVGEYRLGKAVSDNIPITYLWPDTNSVYTDESEGYRNCFGLVENSYSNKIQLGDATIDIIGPKGTFNLEDVVYNGLKITDFKTSSGKDIFQYNITGSESNKLNLGALKSSEDVPLKYDVLGEYGNVYINNYSLVAMISVGNTKFFTAGDIGLNQENELLNSGVNLKADIMKASHHINASSNSKSFIKAVSPKYTFAQNAVVKNPDDMIFQDGVSKDTPYMQSLKYFIYGDNESCTNDCYRGTNMYFEQYSGFTNFNIKNDVINVTPNVYQLPLEYYSSSYPYLKDGNLTLNDNIRKITINYVDDDTSKILATREYRVGTEVTYHLYDYLLNFDGYKLLMDDEVEADGQILSNEGDFVFNIYYESTSDNGVEKTVVNVKDTLKTTSLVLVIISVILIIVGCVFIVYNYIRNKEGKK